jgi:hypothetical protein
LEAATIARASRRAIPTASTGIGVIVTAAGRDIVPTGRKRSARPVFTERTLMTITVATHAGTPAAVAHGTRSTIMSFGAGSTFSALTAIRTFTTIRTITTVWPVTTRTI